MKTFTNTKFNMTTKANTSLEMREEYITAGWGESFRHTVIVENDNLKVVMSFSISDYNRLENVKGAAIPFYSLFEKRKQYGMNVDTSIMGSYDLVEVNQAWKDFK